MMNTKLEIDLVSLVGVANEGATHPPMRNARTVEVDGHVVVLAEDATGATRMPYVLVDSEIVHPGRLGSTELGRLYEAAVRRHGSEAALGKEAAPETSARNNLRTAVASHDAAVSREATVREQEWLLADIDIDLTRAMGLLASSPRFGAEERSLLASCRAKLLMLRAALTEAGVFGGGSAAPERTPR